VGKKKQTALHNHSNSFDEKDIHLDDMYSFDMGKRSPQEDLSVSEVDVEGRFKDTSRDSARDVVNKSLADGSLKNKDVTANLDILHEKLESSSKGSGSRKVTPLNKAGSKPGSRERRVFSPIEEES